MMFGRYKRKITQLVAAVLYNCHFSGFLSGRIYKGSSKEICVPGLNCYSCPGAVFSCPLGSFQGALARSAFKVPLYMLGTLLLFGILFGRMICGFLCPFGLMQEILHKIPGPKIQKSGLTRALSFIKYVILAVFVIAIPLVTLAPGFCKYICPAGTAEAGIPLVFLNENLRNRIGWLFSWKVLVLIWCILICVLCYRAFCRFICPLGAIYSFFNPVAFFGVQVDHGRCSGCGACARACKMDVKLAGDRECIHCGECIDICPEGAICYRKISKAPKGDQTLGV